MDAQPSIHAQFVASLNGSQDNPEPEIEADPFPTDVLPEAWRSYVEAGAAALPCPPELIAVPMLVMLGAIIGNRAQLRLKSSWSEPTSLFAVVIAPSGSLKTPAFKLARWPMNKLQEGELERHEGRMALWEEDHAQWEAEKKGRRGVEPERPWMRDYFTKDVTLEALAVMLGHTPGVVIDEDEIVAWVQRMNQYRKGGDRQQYMSIHSGEAIKVNRKSSGGSLYVPHPVVGVCGGIQPEVVHGLRGDVQGDDGFVYRYLPITPTVGPKLWNDNQIAPEVFIGIAALWRSVDSLPLGGSVEFTLAPTALSLFARWSDHNSIEAHRLGGALRGFYVKLEAHVARFALILHIAQQNGQIVVEEETIHQAIRLGEWFRGEIHRFIPMMGLGSGAGSTNVGLWSRIRKHLDELSNRQCVEASNQHSSEKNTQDGWVTMRDLLRSLGNKKKEEVLNELDTQYDLGAVERREVELHNGTQLQFRISRFDASTDRQFDTSVYIPWEDTP